MDDIFFCGNQSDNRLYLNKGNLKFEDITDKAGINQNKYWSSGVTFADVNGDGYLDIYVSQGGPHEKVNRRNLLFINNQDLTFSEEAESYGLDDRSISTQSAFFDYDKDGDLDCVVMNENPLYGVDPVTFHQTLLKDKNLVLESSSHLYQNQGGKFVDVTVTSGLFRPTFGLGLVVSDLNNDGWLDIYIANDYYLPDNLYINNGKGIFIDQIKERTSHISFYGMGADVADINNDLSQDIFVLDMASSDHKRSKTLMASMDTDAFSLLVNRLGFHNQYMFNSLHLNNGNSQYNNVSHLSEMAKTDWSWAVLMEDFDNNEKKDVYITNGYRRYALDNDFKLKVQKTQMEYRGKVPLDIKESLYYEMPTEKLSNIMYEQSTSLDFHDVTDDWGLNHPSYSNGGAHADLDNDGDLDLVVNNMDEEAFLYENFTNKRTDANYLDVKAIGILSESFPKVYVRYGENVQMQEIKRVRGYLSSVQKKAHFGLGSYDAPIDSVVVIWPSGMKEIKTGATINQVITFYEKDAKSEGDYSTSDKTSFEEVKVALEYRHRENTYNDFGLEVLLPYKQSTIGPLATQADINNDKKDDLLIGGAAGQPTSLFLQSGKGFRSISVPLFQKDAAFEDMGAVFFDLENDGDQDIYIVSGGNEYPVGSINYQDRLYINQGNNQFERGQIDLLSLSRYSGKTAATFDFNQDGFEDIFVANRILPQHYPIPAPSFILKNNQGVLEDVTEEVIPGLSDFGIVNDVLITDFNADGWEDLIVVGEWTKIGFFQNDQGLFSDVSDEYGVPDDRGWWFSVAEADVNGDGRPDYVIGNVGQNTKFKASKKKPFKVFASDFDSTGTLDIVLSKEYQGNYVPVRGRECSSEQMPFIQEKFPTYNEFANATMDDIFGDQLENSYEAMATEFSSVVLINNGDQFEKMILPVEAQLFPALSIVVEDLNNDGLEDFILAGNIYDTEVETPRLDSRSGVVIFSQREGGFSVGPSLNIDGDVKSILSTQIGADKMIMATKNNDRPSFYRIKSGI